MHIPVICLSMIAAATMNAGAQTARATLAPESKLWIEGTSNMHDWKVQASTMFARIEIHADGLTASRADLVTAFALTIPVSDLKSGNGTMDQNLRKAMKSDKNPDIVYRLAAVEVLPGGTADAFSLRAAGSISAAGAVTNVTTTVAVTRTAEGKMMARGTVPFKMSALGIKPPSAMLGLMKTGDDISIRFELVIGERGVNTGPQQAPPR